MLDYMLLKVVANYICVAIVRFITITIEFVSFVRFLKRAVQHEDRSFSKIL